MFNFFASSGINKIILKVLNSKITYIVLIVIILAQFLLTSIIFLQNRKTTEQIANRLIDVQNLQHQLDGKMNVIQSNLMQMQVQFYRMQSGNK
ncbi:hypothetical protein HY798_04815 [Candidatus Falkowbacteria bacterium]|nr:hypothetical protein [Candidatus Falkowbacteria bacterium]